MSDFKNLLVWKKAHRLALLAHRTASKIRGAQNAALRSQITRSAQSIAANIVEGRGQRSDREFARFLGYSINSASELEYHTIVARDAELLSDEDADAPLELVIEVRKMLHGLRARLEGTKQSTAR